MGMSADEYWNGDPQLVVAYRKADEIRKEQRNQELWLQGMYVYEAICDVAPILHAFAKKGAKVHPYSEEPYPLTSKQKKRAEERQAKRQEDKMRTRMDMFVTAFNRQFAEKAAQKAKEGEVVNDADKH